MNPTPATSASLATLVEPRVAQFYRRTLHTLHEAGIPFLLGGTFAHAYHTGIHRPTGDLDLFIRRDDYERIAQLLGRQGWQVALRFPHWLAKVFEGEAFIDLIFNSGNGLAPVDERWFQGNGRTELLGVPVRVMNVEDALMSRAFIMERGRYDGSDVAHLLWAHADRLAWPALLERFGPHWRVLLAHLTLFGFIYPGERHRIPAWVMERLMAQLADEVRTPPAPDMPVCAGTLLSREQYLHDVAQQGYVDGRLVSTSTMTAADIATWTEAIGDQAPPAALPAQPVAGGPQGAAPLLPRAN